MKSTLHLISPSLHELNAQNPRVTSNGNFTTAVASFHEPDIDLFPQHKSFPA